MPIEYAGACVVGWVAGEDRQTRYSNVLRQRNCPRSMYTISQQLLRVSFTSGTDMSVHTTGAEYQSCSFWIFPTNISACSRWPPLLHSSSSSSSGSATAEAAFISASACCCAARSMATSGGASAGASTNASCASFVSLRAR